MNQPDHFTTCESTEFGQADGRHNESLFVESHAPPSRLKAKPLPELDLSPYTMLRSFLAGVGFCAVIIVVGLIFWSSK